MKPELKFATAEWRIETKVAKGKTRYFAVAKVPNATHEAWLIVKEEFAKQHSA
jgi:hypothetical protein